MMDLTPVRKVAFRGNLQGQLFYLLLGLAATVSLAGCSIIGAGGDTFLGPGRVQRWSRRPWSEAFVYRTPHYTVRTNTSPDVAMYIGELMEKVAAGYCEMIRCKNASLPCLIVHAYATRKEYETVVRRQGLPSRITAGLYTPVPPAAIHLPYILDLGVHPSVTLLHEGVHQLVDQASSFCVPETARSALPPAKHALVSIPLWLNEGLATYMEGAAVMADCLEIGRINRDRLVHLQKLIHAGRCPALKRVIARRYGEPFLAEDYAVAWGLVYTLRHAPDANRQADRRKRLSQYLEVCSQAFYTDPVGEFLRDFFPNGRPVEDFDRLWAGYIARRSLEVFEQIIVGEGSTLDAWERDWTARILRLDPRDPYGGLPAPETSVVGNGSTETRRGLRAGH